MPKRERKIDLNITTVGSNSNHSVIKVQIADNWYYFDPTWDAQKRVLSHFFKTKQEFSKDHILSMTEDEVLSPETKAYSKEELTEILNRVIKDRTYKKEKKKEELIEKHNFSKEDFRQAYESEEINQEDLEKAYKIINKTKADREKTHNSTETNKCESRE